MRVGFIGCIKLSEQALKTLLNVDGLNLCSLITLQTSNFNSDFADLSDLANSHNIPTFFADNRSQDEIAEFLNIHSPDVVFCLGWSHLLGKQILQIPPRGVIGYHPSALPHNRGRHPTIWALALGLKETASSFFLMEEKADTGPLVNQIAIPLTREETASSLHKKLGKTIEQQIHQICIDLKSNNLKLEPQKLINSNYWRKRSRQDGLIDWRMSAESIYNLVRALSSPYPGAEFEYAGERSIVWAAKIEINVPGNIEPGKILNVRGRQILIKCGEHAVWLLDHECKNIPKIGEYL
ncbi:methionyl-tRNA formyltransferase [Kiloniella litopenaei]|uniref:methionyl-tRNA formyltransferase n=1 Tax=Kiloniella litopenaei TaxID=1549748 RepID=UPI003BACF51C